MTTEEEPEYVDVPGIGKMRMVRSDWMPPGQFLIGPDMEKLLEGAVIEQVEPPRLTELAPDFETNMRTYRFEETLRLRFPAVRPETLPTIVNAT